MINKLAIDIGSGNIKLVYGHNVLGKISIKECEAIVTPQAAVKNGIVKEVEVIAGTIKDYIKLKKFKPFSVSFVVHSKDIATKLLKFPRMNKKSLVNSIKWELEELYKVQLDKYYLSYEIVEENNNLINILVVLVPVDIIDQYDKISQRIGIRLQHIDIASKCVLRLFRNSNRDFVVIDSGYDSIRYSIYNNKRVFAEREFLYQNTIENFEEGVKRANPIVNDEIYLKPFTRMMDFFLSQKSNNPIEDIYIIGGREIPQEFLNYISQNYNTPIKVSMLENRHTAALKNKNLKTADLFLSVLGLFIRA